MYKHTRQPFNLIYIFLFQGDFKRIVLDEPNKAKARFGTTLSAIGDINLDGCNDIAIGAPYWGQNGEGAIFIYYGSKIDLYSYNYQIILGSDINPLLRGFGISISKGLDIDNNGINGKVIRYFLNFFMSLTDKGT